MKLIKKRSKTPSRQLPPMYLVKELGSKDIKTESLRAGFGRGLVRAGELDDNVVALSADLAESVQVQPFKEAFPERYVEVGVAEQSLVLAAAGMAAMKKIPFAASYSVFSPGRNWEQIRTAICLNDRPVKIIGSHAGVNVGPDGATHQMLEDIALMRALPNMVVVAPADSVEAEKATLALADNDRPSYMRLPREALPVFTTALTPFDIGKAYVLREGHDVAIFGTGSMTYSCLMVAEKLAKDGISAEVVHVPTIKPLDEVTILDSTKRTGRVVTVEEAQAAGGFGSAVAELLSEKHPLPVKIIGVKDRFGESGKTKELLDAVGLSVSEITKTVQQFIQQSTKSSLYHTSRKKSKA